MTKSVNTVILLGNLGRAPEVRYAQDGTKIVNFPLATSDTWKDKNTGERRERTEWHRVVIFNDRLADFAEKYLRKGSKIYVVGSLQTRSWETGGERKYATEVVLQRFQSELVLLDGKEGRDHTPGGETTVPAKPDDREASPQVDYDDEIPF